MGVSPSYQKYISSPLGHLTNIKHTYTYLWVWYSWLFLMAYFKKIPKLPQTSKNKFSQVNRYLLKNSQSVKKVQPYAKWLAWKSCEIQVAAKKWLWWYRSVTNFNNNNSGEFVLLHPSFTRNQHKILSLFVTQSWETVPNRTSGIIKLTPPAYSHTTVLLVSSLNFSALTRGWL